MDMEFSVVIVRLRRWVEVEGGVNGDEENIINQEKKKKMEVMRGDWNLNIFWRYTQKDFPIFV